MKTLRRLFYGISLCIFLVCVAILVFTSNPEWSEKLSKKLYGEEEQQDLAVTETQAPDENVDIGLPAPQLTPLIYVTPTPQPVDEPLATKEPDSYKPQTIDIKTVVPRKAPVAKYNSPLTDKVTIPEAVSELRGMEEPSTKLEEVKNEEATKLKEELDEGDTGALLVFDQRFYPYYHMLNDSEKELYRQIYANAFGMMERFKPCVEVFSTNVGRVVEAVYNDNPVLFWVENSYGCKYGSDGRVVEISLQYNEASNKIDQSRQKFDEKAEEILQVARTLSSDYEKEKYVHDRLAMQVSYAAEAPMNQSAYSALVNGKTVCAGYTRAFQYLMQQLGIPCFYCRGYSGENHAWNIVELYGDYYNVDLTWDDAKPGNYDYFNKTDKDLQVTHIRKGASVNLPACGGTLYGNLETNYDEEPVQKESEDYSQGLVLYYDRICERIEKSGLGSATYTDLLDLSVWKELESAYANGNNNFREDYLIRALHKAGAQYCTISFSAEEVTDNAYDVTCSIVVR